MADLAHPGIAAFGTLRARRAVARPTAVATPGGALDGDTPAPIG